MFSLHFSQYRLLLVDSLQDGPLIFVDNIVRIPYKLEFLFISKSQIVPKVLFQGINQEIILFRLEESIIVLIQYDELFAQVI